MDTISIRKILKKIAESYEKKYKRKLYYKVCACDQLPKTLSKNKDAIIIVNSETSDKSGQHWYIFSLFFNLFSY